MRIALIATRKVAGAERYLFQSCTEVLTNIEGFSHPTLPVIHSDDLDFLIKNSDFVIALCYTKVKRRPPIIAKCNHYKKSFAFTFVE